MAHMIYKMHKCGPMDFGALQRRFTLAPLAVEFRPAVQLSPATHDLSRLPFSSHQTSSGQLPDRGTTPAIWLISLGMKYIPKLNPAYVQVHISLHIYGTSQSWPLYDVFPETARNRKTSSPRYKKLRSEISEPHQLTPDLIHAKPRSANLRCCAKLIVGNKFRFQFRPAWVRAV
ncbi:hypothetical protein F511_16830 [Dorcoceras hygrometricum]|uniref:Uncharacterized protein n=1 Tax=Dorcoceras hygrometricum TaxID=472368 RepID=A0A2Z7ANV6_9LAMI|nr:hypothetical protein F511_16830 [Dorcoceras hygrometricum]